MKRIIGIGLLALLSAMASFACDDSGENSGCSIDSDCATGERCLNGTCVSRECSTDLDCLGTETCEIQAGNTVGLCVVRVDGDAADGDAADGDEPAATGNCVSGVLRCMGDILEVCEARNGELDWRFDEECAGGCALGECRPAPIDGDEEEEEPGPICTPGDYQCWNNQVQICDTDGMQWRLDDPCTDGTCIEQLPDAYCGPKQECSPGLRVCAEAGPEAVEVCKDDGTGWNTMYCAASQECIQGICQSAGVCRNGNYRCNGNTVEICSDDNWSTMEICGEGSTCACGMYAGTECRLADCITDPICTPLLDTRCSGDIVQRCAADGKAWANWTDCADNDEVCVNGECQ